MIRQTKYLKDVLKYYGITDQWGGLRVRCKRNKHKEYGPATAHVRALTPDEIAKLKDYSQFIRIFNSPEHNFAIIEY